MYNATTVISGLVLFFVLTTAPMWYNAAAGQGKYKPEPKLPTKERVCVADKAYMKAFHMDMLNEWRDEVVREDARVYQAFDGRKYNKSLSKTCMNCHSEKAEFCDKCHDYVGVSPYCWDCHVDPKIAAKPKPEPPPAALEVEELQDDAVPAEEPGEM